MTARLLGAVAFCALTGVPGRAVAAADCPSSQRPALLREHPEALLGCLNSNKPADRIWAGHALAALNRFDEAVGAFTEASKQLSSPVLKAALELTIAYDEARAGRPEEAVARVGRLKPKRAWLRSELAAARADLALQARSWGMAERAAHEALALHSPGQDALLLILARAAAAKDDAVGFTKALRTLEVEFPGAESTRSAEALASDALPRPELKPGELADRWSHWIAQGKAQRVADECLVREKTLPAGSVSGRARFQCGNALATVKSAAAEEVLQRAVRDLGVGDQAARAQLLIARIEGHGKDADRVAAMCGEIKPASSDSAAECWFLSAFLRLQAGDREAARAGFVRVRDSFSRSGRARDAAWFLAFDTYEHDREHAFEEFDALLTERAYGIDRAQLLYWRARSRPAADATLARADWEEVVRLDPFGYYGWLAASRLRLDAGEVPAAACSPQVSPSTVEVPQAATDAAALLEAGFGRYAALELNEMMPRHHRQPEEWLGFLTQTEQFERILTIGVGLGGQAGPWPTTPDRLTLVHAAFPTAFPEALSGAPAGVDRCLLLALMRRESRFDPDAVSQAQAYGLLQLLPQTAAAVAKELGEEPPPADQLHDPVTNVRIAGAYVQRLLQRFGNPLLVAAAYNGGPQAVARWTNEMSGIDFDEWVERIPYRETRHYVKAVGGAYAAYALIYGGKRPPFSFEPVRPAPAAGVDY